jgi:fatty aldehyde-generating acyl-ACP reductase
MRYTVSVTSSAANKPQYQGPLDFAFLVHPRNLTDILRAYPDLAGLPETDVFATVRQAHVHIISFIEAQVDGRSLHGELLSLPFVPGDFQGGLLPVRRAACNALHYAWSRQTRIVGLGALLPSVTRYGALLSRRSLPVGITTGHTFTAMAIAEHIRTVESAIGDRQTVAIVGAAGSTGRATVKCLAAEGVFRRLILIDLPDRLRLLAAAVTAHAPPLDCLITHDLSQCGHAQIVVCVTNASSAIIDPAFLSPGCVIIDDAQPENVSFDMMQRRSDVAVLKCLAHVPHLNCPFDFGLCPSSRPTQNPVFTCLAETIMLAAAEHSGHFTIGDPTSEQFAHMRSLSSRFSIGIAPFHSFPEIGEIDLAQFIRRTYATKKRIRLTSR